MRTRANTPRELKHSPWQKEVDHSYLFKIHYLRHGSSISPAMQIVKQWVVNCLQNVMGTMFEQAMSADLS